MDRAPLYGAELEYDICLYLHLMLALGEHFDEDPAHASARMVLDKWAQGSNGVSQLHDMVFGEEDDGEDFDDEGCDH
jgi:hypothetical protein